MFQAKAAEKIKTHILCYINFFENRAVYEIILKNTVQLGRPQTTIRPTRIACWITKDTNTHPEHVLFIAFPLQQWLHEGTSMLRHTDIDCLFLYNTQNVRYQPNISDLILSYKFCLRP